MSETQTAVVAVPRQHTTAAQADAGLIERTVVEGDLSGLTPAERTAYYARVCESLGLNPLTRPFDYLRLNNKLVLYARKDATDQLRRINHVSIIEIERATVGDLYVVTAHAQTPDGRRDSEIGVVSVKGLSGDNLANMMMKASTKAKRRVTLSICGLGWLDETEVLSVPGAQAVNVNMETGEIIEQPPAPTPNAANGGRAKDPEHAEKKVRELMTKKGFDPVTIDCNIAECHLAEDGFPDTDEKAYDNLLALFNLVKTGELLPKPADEAQRAGGERAGAITPLTDSNTSPRYITSEQS